LNSEYKRYLVNDINSDLINLYKVLQENGEEFISYAKRFFTEENNQEEIYYAYRDRFNSIEDLNEKSALFLYLNRHGYNGLVRYNASGGFNVPFGRYKRPYFPLKEMKYFYLKSKKVVFASIDFQKAMDRAKKGDVVYADPPYVPLSATSSFTSYSSNGFGATEQMQLAKKARQLSLRGVPVLISNHNTAFTRKAYEGAKINKFWVQRYISCKGEERNKVSELLALFEPEP